MPIRKQDSNVFDNFELRLNESSKKFLRDASKWAFVLSILGFISSGLLLFIGIFALIFFNEANTVFQGFSEFPPYVYAIIYMLIAIISFFPARYLFNFSRRMKIALAEKNTNDLTLAFKKLKLYFKFIVIAILSLVLTSFLAMLFLVLLNNA